MKSYSIIREHEYSELSEVALEGSILDLGGSKKSGYHELVKGKHKWTVVNFGDMHPGMDLNFNIEEKFPLEDESYDNVVSMNVLEHIFDYHNVFAETARVIKKGGLFVSTVPFMHHIHGSPDDYHRYTESTYRKLASKYGFDIVLIKPLGYGLFSLIFQSVGGWIPTNIIRQFFNILATSFDKLLLNFKLYQSLRDRIPLGYFWVMKKK
jgi:SAM-dependent methyltransferase